MEVLKPIENFNTPSYRHLYTEWRESGKRASKKKKMVPCTLDV